MPTGEEQFGRCPWVLGSCFFRGSFCHQHPSLVPSEDLLAPAQLLRGGCSVGPSCSQPRAHPPSSLSPQKRFRAVYDYNAADEDEVSFQDGDTIINVQQIDDGWMYGTVERTGDTGMLPANYVEAI